MRGRSRAALGLGAVLCAMALLPVGSAAAAFGFTAAGGSPFTVGAAPYAVAIGDLDGDGDADLATANFQSDDVTVLLGHGIAGFTEAPASPFAAGVNPVSVASGDLDGDGDVDLATANFQSDDVTVLLGDGTGGFAEAPGSPFPVGHFPYVVAIGDLDGDGDGDLVTANAGTNDVTVLLGHGIAGFTEAPASPFAVGGSPTSVAIGDLDGDGHPDLATGDAGSDEATVLLGDGTGDFAEAPGSPFAAGDTPHSVAIGDLDGDGDADLVTGNWVSDDVTVLLGDGTGGFAEAPASPFSVDGDGPGAVAIGDLDADGRPDLVTANAESDDLTVLLGDGAGGFAAAPGSPFVVGGSPTSVAIGDLDADGRPDLVSSSDNEDELAVLLNTSTPARRVSGPLDFGTQALGTVSAPRSVRISSTGDAALTVSRVAVEGAGADDFLVGRDTCTDTPVPVDSSCTIEVSYAPRAAGAADATLVISDDSPEGSSAVALAGTGAPPPAGSTVPTAPAAPPGRPVAAERSAPAGPSGPSGPPGRRAIPTIRNIATGPVRVPRSGRIAIARVGCPAGCRLTRLRGRVRIRAGADRRGRHAGRAYKARVVAPRRIAAGSTAKIVLVVPARARRLLLRHGSGRAMLSLIVTAEDAGRLARAAIAVRLAR